MTAIATAAAAAEARVTVVTIRAWCRHGVIAAVKIAGRWAIDTASLARRIEIGAWMNRPPTCDLPPMVITTRTSIPGVLGVVGPAAELAAAFKAGTPVTLGGTKVAGETVRLGYRRTVYDDGLTVQVQGFDSERGDHKDFPGVPCATYLVDMDRLDDAPTIKAAAAEARARSLARARAAERAGAEHTALIEATTDYESRA